MAHNVVLPAGEIGESALEPLSFGLSQSRLTVIDRGEIGFEQLSPVRTEHAVGVPVRASRLLDMGWHM